MGNERDGHALQRFSVHQQAVFEEPDQDLQAILIMRVVAAYLLHFLDHAVFELRHLPETLCAQLRMCLGKLDGHAHEFFVYVAANVHAVEHYPHVGGLREDSIALPQEALCQHLLRDAQPCQVLFGETRDLNQAVRGCYQEPTAL